MLDLDDPHTFRLALTHFAIGLLQQQRASEHHPALPVTRLTPQIQWGWDKLAAIGVAHTVATPRHLDELVAWLHMPVEEWPGLTHLANAAGVQGMLLYRGMPGELCDELSHDGRLAETANLEREMQDLAFKEIIAYCHRQYLPEQYTQARQFIVEHPFLPNGGITIASNTELDKTVRNWLLQAYEPIPLVCRQEREGQEQVALCPRCGWPLQWQGTRAICYSEVCTRLYPNLEATAHWTSVSSDALRTKRGEQFSIVGPECPLVQLYHELRDEHHLECELWPEIDAYDLRVHLADAVWAVDMKDIKDPQAAAIACDAFNPFPSWDRAFYVFPPHRASPAYRRAFEMYWAQPEHTQALFLEEFRALVGRSLVLPNTSQEGKNDDA